LLRSRMCHSRSCMGVCVAIIAALTGLSNVSAATLSFREALQLAQSNDATYLGSVADLTAARERHDQAGAQLLTQISSSFGVNHTNRHYDTLDSTVGDEDSEFDAKNGQLNITQPLWRPAGHAAVTQAQAEIAQGEFQLRAAEYELVIRLAEVWFEMMSARDDSLRSEAKVRSTHREWEQLERATQINLSAEPKREEARAKYEQALAEQLDAETQQQIALAKLEEIAGTVREFDVPHLSDQFRRPAVELTTIEALAQRAEVASPFVLASQQALFAARAEVVKQRAGHQPTVDIVGNYTYNEQGVGNFPGQSGYEIRQRSIGFQVNVPLFSSGLLSARIGEAVAMRSKAEYELRGAVRTARTTSKTAWLGLRSTMAKENAALQAVKSSRLSLQSATTGAAQELNSQLEVLQARANLLEAWSDLQRARYDSVLNWLKLRAVTGELSDTDIAFVDSNLATGRVSLAELRP
jgi:outer membrane protein